MSIVIAWLVYCMAIAAVLTLGAVAWESAARWSGRGARWGWLTALAGAAVLPAVLRLLPERALPEVMPAMMPVFMPVLTQEPVYATSAPAGLTMLDLALAGWATASAVMLAGVVLLLVRLAHARRGWTPAELDGSQVLVSQRMGPAAVGVRRGVVVLPEWALALDSELRTMLLMHEREHVDAGDPRLVVGALLLLSIMPWNPLMWYMVVRLRNAVELDCDARVLRTGVDPRRYGSLLLEVGRRRSSNAFVMATFAEPRAFMEARIRRIAQWPQRRRPARAAAFGVIAVALFTTALSARDPMAGADALRGGASLTDVLSAATGGITAPGTAAAANGTPAANTSQAEVGDVLSPMDAAEIERRMVAPSDTPPPAAELRSAPVYTPMTKRPTLRNAAEVERAMARAYPPELRDAGISAQPIVWLFLGSDGAVQEARIATSSRYPALDEAALSISRMMSFTPAMNRDQPVPVWIMVPVAFTVRTPASSEDRTVDVVRPALGNVADVQEALRSAYPPLLRDAGIGGVVSLRLRINADGVVEEAVPSPGSGYPALDAAAVKVASVMRFLPAMRRPQGGELTRVPTTLLLPLAFVPPDGRVPDFVYPPRTPDGVTHMEMMTTGVAPSGTPTAVGVTGWRNPRANMPADTPYFTPMTQRPTLANQPEVERALVAAYPPALKNAGIGGTATVWFFIDRDGTVLQTRLNKRSGHPELDEAALTVARMMKFNGALNREQAVQVWVEIPIQFNAR